MSQIFQSRCINERNMDTARKTRSSLGSGLRRSQTTVHRSGASLDFTHLPTVVNVFQNADSITIFSPAARGIAGKLIPHLNSSGISFITHLYYHYKARLSYIPFAHKKDHQTFM